jgi:DNA-binding transcriptional MerR regulator
MTVNVPTNNTSLIQWSTESSKGSEQLRIGELALKTGKTKRALRLYEEMGLLVPSERSAGGFRLYHAANAERIFWISKLQDLGFTLPAIQALLSKSRSPGVPKEIMEQIKNEFQKRLEDLEEQMMRLGSLKEELKDSLNHLSGCTGCEQLENKLEVSEVCGCCGRAETFPPLITNLWQDTGH